MGKLLKFKINSGGHMDLPLRKIHFGCSKGRLFIAKLIRVAITIAEGRETRIQPSTAYSTDFGFGTFLEASSISILTIFPFSS